MTKNEALVNTYESTFPTGRGEPIEVDKSGLESIRVGVSRQNLRFGANNWAKVQSQTCPQTNLNSKRQPMTMPGGSEIINRDPRDCSFRKITSTDVQSTTRKKTKKHMIGGREVPRYMSMIESKIKHLTTRLFAERHTDNKDLQNTLHDLNAFIEKTQSKEEVLRNQTVR